MLVRLLVLCRCPIISLATRPEAVSSSASVVAYVHHRHDHAKNINSWLPSVHELELTLVERIKLNAL